MLRHGLRKLSPLDFEQYSPLQFRGSTQLSLSAMGNMVCNSLEIPPPKGPNAAGCTDFMMDHTVQGSFFRLYYPCHKMDKAAMPDWIPSREYFNGLADFLKINRTFSERIFNCLFGSFKIPAFLDAPFNSTEKCPVVIFSHGLGAFRTLYSAICTELASQGFIVASVEQRDLSASATYYLRQKSELETANNNSSKASLKDTLVREWMYYRSLEQGEEEFPLRNQQVQQRADECIRALHRLTDINSGVSVQNVLLTQFDWKTLKNSMDLSKVAVMGHSFGGATSIEALAKETKFKCAVVLDAWMFPLKDETFPQVSQPIFFVNSEKFQWAENIKRIKMLDSSDIERKMMTIRGTVHQSFPDFTFLTGDFIGKLMKLKGDLNPEIAIDLSNKASLAFLQRHLGLEKDFNQWDPLIEGDDENLIPGTNITLLQSAI
ncbi:platelet-activating factor acetylhydrolase isoform X1 [Syngnathoides biaculeatus]|uniref:platelet-activating factor acetylhydrolase isoform X1 n=2 Tax=Syngnathoides biaculeatus TaxID=300417 RepID=UPI002ADE690A|nr:platelet-activating factor acetylhydrolase isoform X1 [Syngnathoides biaculeatus]